MDNGPRALDHLVLPCTDLDAAARAYADLGFLVGRRNRHPWGTENHIVQFAGAFLELIALAPDYAPLAPEDDAFPFAGFLAAQGASARPSAMIVLRSRDAQADAAAFSADDLGTGRMLHFSREGQGPDGSTRKVAFSLAFAAAERMPDLGFFVCQQHHPENFWNAALQRHPNGVTGIAAVEIGAPDPAEHAPFLSRFAGRGDCDGTNGRVVVELAEGTIIVVAPSVQPSPMLESIRFRGAMERTGIHAVGSLALVFGA